MQKSPRKSSKPKYPKTLSRRSSRSAKVTRSATGWDCVLRITHALDGKREWVEARADSLLAHRKNNGSVEDTAAQAARRMVRSADRAEIAALMTGLANPHRLAILHSLLEGPANYQHLLSATQLTAGPLYHHISELRLAGLIGPKARDTYELTELGKRLTVLSVLLPKLARAKPQRRR